MFYKLDLYSTHPFCWWGGWGGGWRSKFTYRTGQNHKIFCPKAKPEPRLWLPLELGKLESCGKWKVLANLVIMFGRYKQYGSCFCSVVFSVLFEKDLFCFYTYNQIEIYYIEQWTQELSSPDQSSICSVEVFVIGYLHELICIFQTTSHLESKFHCFHYYQAHPSALHY